MADTTRTAQNEAQKIQDQVQDQFQQQFAAGNETYTRSLQTWNELVAASSDMAFDAVLRNWNYSKTVRAESDKAIETAVTQQRQLTTEMLNAMQGYSATVQKTVANATRQTR